MTPADPVVATPVMLGPITHRPTRCPPKYRFTTCRFFDGSTPALSAPRSANQRRLGVFATGALADLLRVDGEPTSEVAVIADGGKVYMTIAG
jgi:hypothetical protein